jgi:uncharacterized membrane protein YdjX (TVP38/TMEM64 family)
MPRSVPIKAKLLIVALFIGAVILFYALGLDEYFRFQAIKEYRADLIQYTQQHYLPMLLGAFAVYLVSVALSLPVATVLSLLVGLLFGRWIGTLIIVVAGTLGATLLLLAARYVFADWAKRHLGERAKKFDEGFRRNAFLYVAFLRVVPIFPFWLINLGSAFTSISVRTYTAATAVGMLPISFVWAQLGESLEDINSLQDAFSGTTLIALSALGLLGVIAVYFKGRLDKIAR